MGKLFDYTVFPLLLPFILLWLAAARVLSLLAPFTVLPSVLLARRLYEACPFLPVLFKQRGRLAGTAMRLGLEYNYCANVVRRLLTLPLRRSVPDVIITGFPKVRDPKMALLC